MPTLSINPRDASGVSRTLGMPELLGYLRDSGLFEIKEHDDHLKVMRGERATILYYNDKKIYLDFWEYNTPSFTGKVYRENFDLVIKLQCKNLTDDEFIRRCRKKNILGELKNEELVEFKNKIVPWTFFPSRVMKKFSGGDIEKLPTEQVAFFCGKFWKSRHNICKSLESQGIEIIKSQQEVRSGRPLSDPEYVRKMKTSKYGLILSGRGSMMSEAKNRREVDYMMIKKPVLMNYKPRYYNPLEPDKHFIFIDQNTQIDKLEELYNINEIAENGYQWYLENSSPMGAAKTFLQIMNDRFGE